MSERPTGGGGVAAQRVFLDWDGPLLPRAADWLLGTYGRDLAHVVVALPGSRAMRRLEALLVERAAAAGLRELSPPRLITAGRLGDELLLPQHPVAGRLLRTLLWCDALAALPAESLRALFREPPAGDDRGAWLAFAEDVRSVHATLAAERRDFAEVAAALPEIFGAAREQPSARAELQRWQALAELQRDYRARIEAAGFSDPHEGRLASLRARAFVPEFAESADVAGAAGAAGAGRVVLVGVAELNGLTRELLEQLGPAVTALIGAPETEAAAFDPWGAALTAAWSTRPLPLERATWCVVDTPDDQAACALDILDGWVAADAAELGAADPARPPTGGAASAPDVVCGVPDEAVTPFLERRLAERGVTARPGTAGPFRSSPAGRLLAALHDLLATGSFAALATFARHPAAHAALFRHAALTGRDPLALLDAAQARHLPARVCGPGVPPPDWPTLAPVLAALAALLGELLTGRPRAWSAWAEPLRAALSALFGDEPLLREAQDSHATHASLGVLAEALAELQVLPVRGEVTAREALALLLRACAATEVPPRADSAAVDLLGWLELPLDESPDVLLTGFNAGTLPAPPASARWLPEPVRAALAVPGEGQRLARDAFLLAQLLHGRRRVALISGRVGSERDPLLPSPLAFQVPDADIAGRVRQWLPSRGGDAARAAPGAAVPTAQAAHPVHVAHAAPVAGTGAAAHAGDASVAAARAAGPAGAPAPRPLPKLDALPAQRSVSVTGFRAYLASPYRYYLERVLHLQRAEDDAHELDPQGFGTLAHDVLQAFGQGPAKHAEDEGVVRDALHAALDRLARARFGPRPQAAVAVQLEQLRYRLTRFATWQAASSAEGWRIAAVEWAPEQPVLLDAGSGTLALRGRIDRIDVHVDGRRWRVLDYKTGDEVKQPEAAHRAGDGSWRDLQLPLYALLVTSFAAARGLVEPPALGYVALPRTAEADCVRLADWSAADLEEAHEKAREVCAAILAGEFFEAPDGSLGDPILDAIAGQGLLETPEDARRAVAAAADGGAGDDA